LLKKVELQQRIAELTEPEVRKTRVTLASLLAELEAAIEGAKSS
jgi:hypothetical protein